MTLLPAEEDFAASLVAVFTSHTPHANRLNDVALLVYDESLGNIEGRIFNLNSTSNHEFLLLSLFVLPSIEERGVIK